MAQMEKLDKIEDKAARKARTAELIIEYFAVFIKESLMRTSAVGCHVMAAGLKRW